jgi:dolichol-phosphate mannosyltransferase
VNLVIESREFVKNQDKNTALQLAVIVPVLNERDNIVPLLSKLANVLKDIVHEVIFVDDGSKDGTQAEIEEIARFDSHVRLVRRFGRRGLSSAVIEGMCASVADVVAVIDGDLQHDETILPKMYSAIADDGKDLAIGTRYSGDGSVGDWNKTRVSISRFATRLASPIMKTPLSDPMSGFFAIRRSVLLDLIPQLSTVGYKILLDIVASAGKRLNTAELPYRFGVRVAGESKLDSAVILEYLELILDKLFGRILPAKLILFGAVGGSGVIIHMAVLSILLNLLNQTFTYAQIGAVIVAMLYNFTLNNNFTYRDRRLHGFDWIKGLLSFSLLCSLGAVANVGVSSIFYERDADHWWLAGLAGVTVGSVWNFVATKWLTWRQR